MWGIGVVAALSFLTTGIYSDEGLKSLLKICAEKKYDGYIRDSLVSDFKDINPNFTFVKTQLISFIGFQSENGNFEMAIWDRSIADHRHHDVHEVLKDRGLQNKDLKGAGEILLEWDSVTQQIVTVMIMDANPYFKGLGVHHLSESEFFNLSERILAIKKLKIAEDADIKINWKALGPQSIIMNFAKFRSWVEENSLNK